MPPPPPYNCVKPNTAKSCVKAHMTIGPSQDAAGRQVRWTKHLGVKLSLLHILSQYRYWQWAKCSCDHWFTLEICLKEKSVNLLHE
jgi:hypothetical protein